MGAENESIELFTVELPPTTLARAGGPPCVEFHEHHLVTMPLGGGNIPDPFLALGPIWPAPLASEAKFVHLHLHPRAP